MQDKLVRALILLVCSTSAIGQGTGRRIAGEAGLPTQPQVQTSGCPDGQDGRPPAERLSPGDYVELQRTECFGSCPVYKVRVNADGEVAWNGERYVETNGPRTSHIAPDDARSLIDQFRAAGFWSLCEHYTRPVTDLPTTITILHQGATEKTVSDRANSAPDWLRDLDRAIDVLADTHAWIHGDPRLEKLPTLLGDWRGPKPGLTPLMQAADKGDLREVERLLSAHADPNEQDSSGATALLYATAAKPDVVTALLRAGANPNIPTFMGQTAIMAAGDFSVSPEEKLKLLIAAGGDVNAQDIDGQTALMLAVRSHFEQPEVVAFLVESGARRDITDVNGISALDKLEKDPQRSKLPAVYERLRQLLQGR